MKKKTLINEVKQLQKIAGILKENSLGRSSDYEFIKGPKEDPAVGKVFNYLDQNYENGSDFEYDPEMQKLTLFGDELVNDGTLVQLLANVFQQPDYEDWG